jgi:hypothetical protein
VASTIGTDCGFEFLQVKMANYGLIFAELQTHEALVIIAGILCAVGMLSFVWLGPDHY